jgi:DNA repair protein RAD5
MMICVLCKYSGLGKTVMLLAMICKSKETNNDKNSDGATLVVAPLSLLNQWQEELETKTSLSYRAYYGDKKCSDYDGVDVVVTTCKCQWYLPLSRLPVAHTIYLDCLSDGSLQGELQVYMRKKESHPDAEFTGLLAKKWKRVILDEAHFVKNSATVASRACCLLQAERRWCVSGTIIQNSLDDVYSLLKFLRHEPWCEHGFWKAAIGKVEDMSVALDRVRRLLSPIMLRRTKDSVDKHG